MKTTYSIKVNIYRIKNFKMKKFKQIKYRLTDRAISENSSNSVHTSYNNKIITIAR